MKRKRLQFVLALLTAAAGAWAQATATTSATRTGSDNTYTVKMKEGTKDAAKWTIASDGNSTTGDQTEGLTVAPEKEVRLTYSGRLKVKSVTATHDGTILIDLSNIPASLIGSDGHTVTVPDGTTLTGTLDGQTHPYKIVIPDGAKVTLAGVNIYGENNENYKWAGINCEGDATIILADNTTNVVKGFHRDYPGIYVPGDKDDPSKNKTLIIKGGSVGSGELKAIGNGQGCGIGGARNIACGNIIIEGGNIKAEGGYYAAGIGSGQGSSCGFINIYGGTVEATGGDNAAGIGSSGNRASCADITITGGIVTANATYASAGIGSGHEGSSCGDITISGGTVTANSSDYGCAIGGGDDASCGDITITKDVTLVTATKGNDSPFTIGFSYNGRDCGTVTIGCELDSEGKPVSGTGTVYYDGETKSYQNGGDVYLAQSPLTLVNLGKLTDNYKAPNGTTLFGTLKGSEQPYKVSIAYGATVTLYDVTINGVHNLKYQWAGITCEGDATIILKDGTENTVRGFYEDYPGIYVPEGKTLIIKGEAAGTGELMASSNGYGAGIGGGYEIACGSIEIQGGKITATGGRYSAGIGSGDYASCGDITISGGTVEATGGDKAAGIGSGYDGASCGNITISGGTVEAKGGDWAAGIGSGYNGASCGNITISGGTVEASGGYDAAGIGSGYDGASCGNITISGGTVEATGGDYAAGIGSGDYASCGDITITTGVTKVTATKGDKAPNSIGYGSGSDCGTVTIGCTLDNGNPIGGTVYWNGTNYTSDGQNYLSQSPLIYEPGN